jgi:hypothetical protein
MEISVAYINARGPNDEIEEVVLSGWGIPR